MTPQPINHFVPRDYQIPILKALDKGCRKVLAIMPRRCGKDITALNYMIKRMVQEPGVYFYIFPTYSQAKKVIWDSITNEGQKVLDYFPSDLIIKKNSQEMKIRLRCLNGKESIFQLIGSDNYDALMGTNARGFVFSEYALQNPDAFLYLRPIITANRGWCLFLSTPRGKNHLFDLYQTARSSPDWFCYKLTVDDTKHLSAEEIEIERKEMSEDMIQQEYFTSFEMGVEGSFYNKYLEKCFLEKRIGEVPLHTDYKVHTAWDIGVGDKTVIIFFQKIGSAIHIIDCYENSGKGLEHYAEVLSSRFYSYGTHIAPHDIRVREWGSGITRLEKAENFGIHFEISKNISILDGIEAARTLFSRLWIDQKKCRALIDALENYRSEYDPKKRTYHSRPLHNWSSHFADAYRYLAIAEKDIEEEFSKEKLNTLYLNSQFKNNFTNPLVAAGGF